jgi:hypothetical protein
MKLKIKTLIERILKKKKKEKIRRKASTIETPFFLVYS